MTSARTSVVPASSVRPAIAVLSAFMVAPPSVTGAGHVRPLYSPHVSLQSRPRMPNPPSLAGQRGGYEKARYGVTQCGCARAFGLDGGRRALAGQGQHQGPL